MPTMTEEEVLKSLSEMKNNKAPSENGVVVEVIKLGGSVNTKQQPNSSINA